ncbi:hypothetical protein N9D66_00790 [Candidatus Nanopelagicales bacterium]|nr:hypothetical protein [Candidatus Nanopelagicales bacterium]
MLPSHLSGTSRKPFISIPVWADVHAEDSLIEEGSSTLPPVAGLVASSVGVEGTTFSGLAGATVSTVAVTVGSGVLDGQAVKPMRQNPRAPNIASDLEVCFLFI